MPWIKHFLVLVNALLADRSRLALENAALRQQIVVLKRSVNRAKINDSDRDSIYGRVFRKKLVAIGIAQVISARKSLWQNPYVEPVIGSIRRDCTDQVIALGERHLVRVLSRYASYYNESRTHLSLMGNSPVPRAVEDGVGEVIAVPHLGGLHHRYARAA